MAVTGKYVPAAREQAFLDTIESPKYDRGIINGLRPFFQDKAPEDIKSFYSPDELTVLSDLHGTERDVEARMPVKMTRHFFEMAKNSRPLQRIIKANPNETLNLMGSEDPGHQMDFAPVEGMLHKYEMGLLYVVSTCSAHCRFCYREELIAQKEVERQDGTVATNPRVCCGAPGRCRRCTLRQLSSMRQDLAWAWGSPVLPEVNTIAA